MNTSTLVILGAAAAAVYMLTANTKKTQAAAQTRSAGRSVGVSWGNSGGAPVPMPQDSTSIVSQVNYYTKNPNTNLYGVLFPHL